MNSNCVLKDEDHAGYSFKSTTAEMGGVVGVLDCKEERQTVKEGVPGNTFLPFPLQGF